MSKIRPMRQQLTYAVRQAFEPGRDKHAAKIAGTKSGIYSYSAYRAQLDTAKAFAGFLKDRYPEIRQAVDIRTEQVNEFLQEKALSCRQDTLQRYASDLRGLVQHMEHAYKSSAADPKDIHTPAAVSSVPIRTARPMSDQDYKRLLGTYSRGLETASCRAAVLSHAAGLRCEECATIRADQIRIIDATHAQVYVTGGKGGRDRCIEVRIREDVHDLQRIRAAVPAGRICPVQHTSLRSDFYRHKQAAGIGNDYRHQNFHSLRKAYAQREYDRCRTDGMSKYEAVRYVNEQLGHSAERDERLLGRYVENIW